ncbi:MAG: type VI secretion system baseplate subunit TssF [Myxococcales bacterium]|nr:type VI secretion system baseplate subunit TssF [Myxococcales bacterium]MDD9969227.1 type VI secretion system baseplate subunit TssF [Myxococcales bacterium]
MLDKEDPVYKEYLSQLEALEKQRIGYTADFPEAPLDREDPDVRRIIEALAMFTARTRQASKSSIERANLRVFQQHFPHVLNPLPAMAMLAARLDLGHFKDVADLPRWTEVVFVSRPDPAALQEEPPREVYFRTLVPMRMVPLSLEHAEIFRRPQRGYRMVLELAGVHELEDPVGELPLYINHLNDFGSSLTVRQMLSEHLEGVAVVYDEDVDDSSGGIPCEHYFGEPECPAETAEAYEHALHHARSLIHFPQQTMYLNIRVGAGPERYRRCTLILDLDQDWPAALRLNADTFHLNVTPIINMRRDLGAPLDYDGTRDRHLIRHPEIGGRFTLHSVLGVYEMGDAGLQPLKPGVVEWGEGAYEVELEGKDERRRGFLSLELPNAFDEPMRVVAEAYWHQPELARPEVSRSDLYDAGLTHRYLEGVRWECVGPVTTGMDNPLVARQEGLLRLLSIKNQRFLSLDDVRFLLDALAINTTRHFREVSRSLVHLEVESKPHSSLSTKSTGFKYVYRLTVNAHDPSELPVLGLFCASFFEILQAWSIEEVVELEVLVPRLEHTMRYP